MVWTALGLTAASWAVLMALSPILQIRAPRRESRSATWPCCWSASGCGFPTASRVTSYHSSSRTASRSWLWAARSPSLLINGEPGPAAISLGALSGTPAVIAGVPLTPGLSSRERRFSTRATSEELWAALDVAGSPSGREALWSSRRHGEDQKALRRFSAYLAQARSFYFASGGIDLVSRPLASYYAVLNLAKAWLTLCDPSITDPTPPPARPGRPREKRKKLFHDTSDELDASKQRYYFSQERLAFQPAGVFAEIAKRGYGTRILEEELRIH
jgi:YaaC-like Protein